MTWNISICGCRQITSLLDCQAVLDVIVSAILSENWLLNLWPTFDSKVLKRVLYLKIRPKNQSAKVLYWDALVTEKLWAPIAEICWSDNAVQGIKEGLIHSKLNGKCHKMLIQWRTATIWRRLLPMTRRDIGLELTLVIEIETRFISWLAIKNEESRAIISRWALWAS